MQEARREELERAWQAWFAELFAETADAARECDVRTPVPVREAA
jgi:hypothetical protein